MHTNRPAAHWAFSVFFLSLALNLAVIPQTSAQELRREIEGLKKGQREIREARQEIKEVAAVKIGSCRFFGPEHSWCRPRPR